MKGSTTRGRRVESFIVTGSARLDVYRRGGDSLQGRHHAYRLHLLSLLEAGGGDDVLQALLRFGGFPEPFLRGTERHWRRWHRERIDRVVRDDVRDLERVREISLVELLADALPARVGSPLSVRNLREDLEIAHDTAERWIRILENLYVCFRIPPFGAPRIRAVKKEVLQDRQPLFGLDVKTGDRAPSRAATTAVERSGATLSIRSSANSRRRGRRDQRCGRRDRRP